MVVLSSTQLKTLGNWCRQWRLNGPCKYRKQIDAAKKIGISAQFLGRIEKGICGPPMWVYLAMGKVYKVHKADLRGRLSEIFIDEIHNQLR